LADTTRHFVHHCTRFRPRRPGITRHPARRYWTGCRAAGFATSRRGYRSCATVLIAIRPRHRPTQKAPEPVAGVVFPVRQRPVPAPAFASRCTIRGVAAVGFGRKVGLPVFAFFVPRAGQPSRRPSPISHLVPIVRRWRRPTPTKAVFLGVPRRRKPLASLFDVPPRRLVRPFAIRVSRPPHRGQRRPCAVRVGIPPRGGGGCGFRFGYRDCSQRLNLKSPRFYFAKEQIIKVFAIQRTKTNIAMSWSSISVQVLYRLFQCFCGAFS